MRILLDEHLPVRLARVFSEHEVSTVRREGWSGRKNGELLRLACAAGFRVLLTNDRSIEHQQGAARSDIGIVVFGARLLAAP